MFEVGAIEAGQYYSEERRLLLLQDSLVNRLKVTTVTIRPNFRQDLHNRSAKLKMRLSLTSIRWIININSKKIIESLINYQRIILESSRDGHVTGLTQKFCLSPSRILVPWDDFETIGNSRLMGQSRDFGIFSAWFTHEKRVPGISGQWDSKSRNRCP